MPGIEWIKQTENGVEMFCDCGAVTVLVGGDPGTVEMTGDAGEGQETISVPASGGEVAFTCPGCGTSHWLTFAQRKDPS